MQSTTISNKNNKHAGCYCDFDDFFLRLPQIDEKDVNSTETRKACKAVLDEAVVKTLESKLDEISPELHTLSLFINDNPELAFEEYKAHDAMTEFMSKHGFSVERHYHLETAWRAEYSVGSGGRVLGVNSEMDALPGIGHACGHNLIGICGIGIAIAAKEALEKHGIAGKIVILGTPAEENGGGKAILLSYGAYKDMDVCLMAHPGPGLPDLQLTSDGTSTASQHMLVKYIGKPAHAAASPWLGINALDAAVSAYNSVSMLRQQMMPDLRVHGIIEGDGWAPNVIPNNSTLNFIARAPSKRGLTDLVQRLRGCFNGAASATGCDIDDDGIDSSPAYLDLRQNSVLAKDNGENVARYGIIRKTIDVSGSTDFGNVSYEIPSLHSWYTLGSEAGIHTADFTDAARTHDAHNRTIQIAKGLAITGVRVLSDDAFYSEVREAFLADLETHRIA